MLIDSPWIIFLALFFKRLHDVTELLQTGVRTHGVSALNANFLTSLTAVSSSILRCRSSKTPVWTVEIPLLAIFALQAKAK